MTAPIHKSNAYLFPRVLADIGGTHARFAIAVSLGAFTAFTLYHNKDFSQFTDVLQTYLSSEEAVKAGAKDIQIAAIAIASPLSGDRIQMTNLDWSFSITEVKNTFHFSELHFFNDFYALAMALPFLNANDTYQMGGKSQTQKRAKGLLGAGTGLGVSALIPHHDKWIPLETEGGHVTLAAFNEQEAKLIERARSSIPHISAERFLTGSGLELLYRLLLPQRHHKPDTLKAHEITTYAMNGECIVCQEALNTFCAMLGTVASNLALSLGAKGGIYIGGGIVPRLGNYFAESIFRKRFEDKGRFSAYLAEIPVFIITNPYATLVGLSHLLSQDISHHT